MYNYQQFALDCLILSICSAFGQIFIYKTIDIFGPVTFQFFGTFRQLIGILISCYTYGHVITGIGIIGVLIVFFALFIKLLFAYLKEKK